MIYTAWGQDGQANTFHPGTERPRFSDGRFQDDCEELIWTIEADTWEEAMTKYHELQGWEPYVPFDPPNPTADASSSAPETAPPLSQPAPDSSHPLHPFPNHRAHLVSGTLHLMKLRPQRLGEQRGHLLMHLAQKSDERTGIAYGSCVGPFTRQSGNRSSAYRANVILI